MNVRRRRLLGTAAAGLAFAAFPFAASAAQPGARMKIGVIGSGQVGGTLGEAWARAGHEVMFSSLDLDHDKALAARIGANARAGTPREAAKFGDVLLVSVPYHAMPAVGKNLGALLEGKAVIDTSNPIAGRDGEIGAWAAEKGAGLASAELLPGARIVRAFNAVGYARMREAASRKERAGMPIAGDDRQAIAIASRLVRDAGYEPVLVGDLAFGRHLVPRGPFSGERPPAEIRKIAETLK
ncbi:MAG: NADPH-dependent F420 reductase [Burkholderiales bacterium]|nr:NADPH-dependent F420 reductase [Burkholderiales bacterium]